MSGDAPMVRVRTIFISDIHLGTRGCQAEALLELDVSLDPASRAFKASARLNPAERDFRFLLHESLQVTGASAAYLELYDEDSAHPRFWRGHRCTDRDVASIRDSIDDSARATAVDGAGTAKTVDPVP